MNIVEWKTEYILRKYFSENFHLIPLLPLEKKPFEKEWNLKKLNYMEARNYIQGGYNIGIVSGEQSRNDNGDLLILDFDGKPYNGKMGKENLEKCLKLSTWFQNTPKGFHLLFRVDSGLETDIIRSKAETYCKANNLSIDKLHRTTWDGSSDEEHGTYFESLRFSSMFVVASPSKVKQEDGTVKSYWWLSDMKNCEIMKL